MLQLVHSFDHGGVETLATMVGDGLRARGIAVRTYFLYPRSGGGRASKLAALGKAARVIRAERPDVLIAYQSTASVLSGVVGRLAGVPVRIVHQTAMPEGVDGVMRRLDRWAGGAGLYSVNVVNSEACAAEYAGYPARYRQRLRLIPHGLAPLEARRTASDTRSRLGIAPDTPVLLSAGRLIHQKAQDRIIAALPLLARAHLVLAGGGPAEAQYRQLAERLGVSGRVVFTGAVERQEVAELIGAADVFVFPTRWETFGLAPVEAAMAGVPLVVSDLPVLREVLSVDGQSPARFVAADDAAALAAAIEDALVNPGARDAAIAFAHALIERHRPERMIDAYVRLVTGEGPR